ncbi:hypothetical protein CLOP_g2373 [Closterium sp. NIES-67]|nr:hypothetical protein CLOP_g2373 [Closterium sp. NIES-67]
MWFVSVKTLASFDNSHVKSSFVCRMCFFYFVECEVSIVSQPLGGLVSRLFMVGDSVVVYHQPGPRLLGYVEAGSHLPLELFLLSLYS